MVRKAPNPIDVHVGARMRMRRMLVGMSQEALGTALGLTFQQVQKYEKGMNRMGSSRLYQISTILDVPIQYFFEDMPDSVIGAGAAPGAPAEIKAFGFGEGDPTDYVVDFLTTTEGLQLNRAFVAIKSSKVRRRVVDLVRTLANEEIEGDEEA
ncbi:MAG: helix-turn-helix domain-containing protein [Alphaproteobacteria bacterium]